MKQLLKVLEPGLISPYRSFKYEINKWYICDDFDSDKNNDCSNGFYATNFNGLSYSYRKGREVWSAEVDGDQVEINQFKRRYEKQRIVRQLSMDEIKTGLKKANETEGYDVYHSVFPVNPLHGDPVQFNEKHLLLLKKWASVWASVGASVWASVGASVWASVGASVWASVGASVGASIWASVRDYVWDSVRASVGDYVRDSVRDYVWAYISSLFPNIKNWKYIDHKKGINPFQPAIDLWHMGIVPSYDGKKWRLHSGRNATIIWEGYLE